MITRLLIKDSGLFWRIVSLVSVLLPTLVCYEDNVTYYVYQGIIIESKPYEFLLTFYTGIMQFEVTIQLQEDNMGIPTDKLFENFVKSIGELNAK